MQQTLSKLREKRAKGENGFTLIELLVVVVILGVLIAIAVPLYLNYRKGANDSAAQSDLRNAISTLEQCNASNNAYPTANFTLPVASPGTNKAGTCDLLINLSTDTKMQYVASTGVSYVIVSTNTSGSTKFYCYNSTKGGQVATMATAPTGGVVTGATATSC